MLDCSRLEKFNGESVEEKDSAALNVWNLLDAAKRSTHYPRNGVRPLILRLVGSLKRSQESVPSMS